MGQACHLDNTGVSGCTMNIPACPG
jgi:hypothetical protein